MKMIGSIVEEQGVTFGLVLVKRNTLDTVTASDAAVASFQPLFPGLPVVLAAQDSNGQFKYYGRPDISKFLAAIDPTRIPWKEYIVS